MSSNENTDYELGYNWGKIGTELKPNGKYSIDFMKGYEKGIREFNQIEDTIYPSLFSEAEKLISQDRRVEYGSAKESFERIAKVWSVLLRVEISAKQVAECMIAFKLLRENHQHKRDNLVDLMGYAGLIEQILK